MARSTLQWSSDVTESNLVTGPVALPTLPNVTFEKQNAEKQEFRFLAKSVDPILGTGLLYLQGEVGRSPVAGALGL
jgi:hypothetical protein